MDSSNQTTKEKILTVALDMFSTRGYSSVSIRDISGAIGIKESSIYHHFTNKQSIFDELLLRILELMKSMKHSFDKTLSLINEVSQEAFVQAGISYVENFLLEGRIYNIINMLNIEKNTNKEAANYYIKFLFDIPLEHHQQVFTILKDMCVLKNIEPDKLASEYQAIIIFIFFKYFPSRTHITHESIFTARNELAEMLIKFYSQYFKGDETNEDL